MYEIKSPAYKRVPGAKAPSLKDYFLFHISSYGLDEVMMQSPGINPQTAGVPYTEQNHLHRQRQEFRIRNNAQKMKENDVKTILSSLAHLILIRLPFCMSTAG